MQHPYRVVVAVPGLDGRDRDATGLSRALRDAGFEVIDTGASQSPAQVAETVLQEDADAVGLSISVDSPPSSIPLVVEELRARKLDDVLVFGGGALPDADLARLAELGVAAPFAPGTPPATITDWLAAALEGRD